jgi:hypothetical protein
MVVLVTVRLYAGAWRQASQYDWREGLLAAQVQPDAVDAFAALFDIIATHRSRKLEVACIYCGVVTPDEGLFLQLICALQRKQVAASLELMSEWLADAAARTALLPAQSLANALAAQGLILPPRRCGDTPLSLARKNIFGSLPLH